MFTSPLSAAQKFLDPVQKKALAVLAYQLSVADGTVTPEEDVSVDGIIAELALDVEVSPGELFEKIDPAVFDSKRARNTAMLELLCLAYADHKFHPDESTMMRDLARNFGINDQTYAAMEDWAQRQIGILSEVAEFLDLKPGEDPAVPARPKKKKKGPVIRMGT